MPAENAAGTNAQALDIERERTAALTLRLDESNCQHGEALKQSEKLRAEILKLKRELSNLRRKRRESLTPPAAPPRPVWQTPSNHPQSDAARIAQENADFALALRAQQQEKQSAQQLQADRDYVLREATIEARMDADFELARELQKQEDQSRRQVEADEEFAKTVAPVMCMMCCCEVLLAPMLAHDNRHH